MTYNAPLMNLEEIMSKKKVTLMKVTKKPPELGGCRHKKWWAM